MNEQTQLDAIQAELVSEGYAVEQNVRAETLDLQGQAATDAFNALTLDLVARLVRRPKEQQQPKFVIVEVANRARPKPLMRGRIRIRLKHIPEDVEALHRFEAISAVLFDRADAVLQIRFFDISADQANARVLRETKVRVKKAMVEKLRDDQKWLSLAAQQPAGTHALIVARIWAHWVRVVGHIFPGQEHVELKQADLRTIQKDLFDYKIVQMHPSHYAGIHNEILAVVEGGDISPARILELVPDLWLVLDAAVKHYGAKVAAPEQVPPDIILKVMGDINSRAPKETLLLLRESAMSLAQVWNSDRFPSQLASFLLEPNVRNVVSEDLLEALLRHAARLG
ncbi:hypothetical protein AAIH70_25945 [Neorhizobium sp. BT27B]|uniref:hypothetical protein n=1 Tax=Neorhizobium sp. BT27B TaxID=3142625 RepID=UPI003D2C292C